MLALVVQKREQNRHAQHGVVPIDQPDLGRQPCAVMVGVPPRVAQPVRIKGPLCDRTFGVVQLFNEDIVRDLKDDL